MLPMEATEARNPSSTEFLVFTPNMVHLTTALAQQNESNQAITRQSCGSLFSRLPLNMTRCLVVSPIFRQKGHLGWGLANLGVLKRLGTSRGRVKLPRTGSSTAWVRPTRWCVLACLVDTPLIPEMHPSGRHSHPSKSKSEKACSYSQQPPLPVLT